MSPPRKTMPITQAELREKLDYDPMTGVFTWKADGKGGRGIRRGARAGSVDPNGYRYIRLNQKDHLAQRLAWFWVNDEWPGFLRFQDGDRDNCAISNLRDSSYAEPGKHDWRTKEGKSAQQKAYRATIVDRMRGERLEKTFGITLEEYNRMHDAQDGKCAICGEPETAKRNGKTRWLAVDHCHDSGRVRGLLCGTCNPMIGYAKDNIEILEKAIAYLRSHQGDTPTAMYAMTEINGPEADQYGGRH